MSILANIQSPQRPHNSMEMYMYIPQQIILPQFGITSSI